MSAARDLEGWTDGREAEVGAFLAAWSDAASRAASATAADERTDAEAATLVADWFDKLALDDVETVEIDGHHGVYATRSRAGAGPTILVVGVHDLPASGGADDETRPAPRADSHGVLGAGVASRFGSFVAHVEAYMALSNGKGLDVNLQVLTVSEHLLNPAALGELVDRLNLGAVDGIIATAAVAWDLGGPTITVGARGELVVEVSIDTGRDVSTSTFSGAVRNPLTLLVEAIGQLRESNGRISLPGFYHRARPASEDERQLLAAGAIDAGDWLRATGTSVHDGGPSSLERVSMWPSLEIVSIGAGVDERALTHTIPGQASAILAFQLVPDQRPVEIEAALRSWLEQRIHPEVALTIHTLSAADPYQVDRSSTLVLAQARALKSVCGGAPTPVSGGGTPGLAGLATTLGVPMIFSGLAAPASHVLTGHERLSMQRLQLGVMLAGETFIQLQPGANSLASRFSRFAST